MKRKVAKFEMTAEELEVLIYVLVDWRRLKSDLSEYAEYPNNSASATKLVHFFHAAWQSLQEKQPLDKDK